MADRREHRATVGCAECSRWIQQVDVTDKVIILKCNRCDTAYTLFPNGQISYEMPTGITIGGFHVR